MSEAKSVKPFRLGFIGAGGISHMHAKHAKKNEGVELAAASDVSVKALALQLGGWPQAWSPDDREIAFNHGPQVAILRVDGSAPLRS